MAKNGVPVFRRIDWLAVAIGNQGGIAPAAKALKVSKKTIYAWLANGLAEMPFGMVAKLSEKEDVPLQFLARRLGPWEGPMLDAPERAA